MTKKGADFCGQHNKNGQTVRKLVAEKEIEHKIEEIGYLGIAQEYVRRKGFHEAIDVYIEQHTPTISIKENSDEPEYIVTLNNEFIESADVTCHRLLFNLDVKHIYTFNYDN